MADAPHRTFIDADTSIDGKISGQNATIAGRFSGEVRLTGQLSVAAGAEINATVEADVAEVSGSIQGDVKVTRLVILETGRVAGTVDAKQLVVRDGAVLNGPVAAGATAAS